MPRPSPCLLVAVLGLISWPTSALATQTHGGLEGLYVHQVAHIFFALSMGLLIFWLRKWRLTASLSWRYIQYAAVCFIAWNLDTMATHWLLEQSGLIAIEQVRSMQIRIVAVDGRPFLCWLYYLTKMDHLLCVPALFFLFLGLRRLLRTALPPDPHGGTTP